MEADDEAPDDLLDLLDGLVRELWAYACDQLEAGDRLLDVSLSRIVGSGRAQELVREVRARLADRQRDGREAQEHVRRQRLVLDVYAAGAAARAVEDHDPEHLVRGLVALALAGIEDPQDTRLVLIARSARLMRMPRKEVFERAAAIVGEPTASILREYARDAPRETARLIRELGYLEVRDGKGFRYEADLTKTGWF